MPREIEVKSVLNKSKRRDPWFLDDYTFNPYSSCAFNCLFCYIRGSKYGTNLEKSLSVKVNALEILERQLRSRARKNQHGIIVLSSATDPYLSIERKYQLTRQALEIILKYRFPVHMITKSDLIIRDFDLLDEIRQAAILPEDLKALKQGVIISFSFSSMDVRVSKIFEPGAPSPDRRKKALQSALDRDFLAGVSLMPLIPYVSDTTEQLHATFSELGRLKVRYVLPATITLFGNGKADSKTLMFKAIGKHYPEILDRYHRFFERGYEMPRYYQRAFNEKMKELCAEYGLEDSILKAAANDD